MKEERKGKKFIQNKPRLEKPRGLGSSVVRFGPQVGVSGVRIWLVATHFSFQTRKPYGETCIEFNSNIAVGVVVHW